MLGLDAGTSDGQLLDRVTGLKTAEAELLASRARIADLEGKAAKQAEAVKRWVPAAMPCSRSTPCWGGGRSLVQSVVPVVTGKLEAPKLSCVMERRWRMPCTALERSLSFSVLPLFWSFGRWKTRFNREEEGRVEAEAKAAFCEHKLHEMGVNPFAHSSAPADDNPTGEPDHDAADGADRAAVHGGVQAVSVGAGAGAGVGAGVRVVTGAEVVDVGLSPLARTPRASSDAFDLIQKQVCVSAALSIFMFGRGWVVPLRVLADLSLLVERMLLEVDL